MTPTNPDDAERSDAELLRAYAAGDPESMGALVDRYRTALFSWFLGMAGNRSDAEDLYQEVWMRVIRNAGKFKDVSFKAWMWKIARNLLIDFRRKRKAAVSLDAVDDKDDQPLVDQLSAVGPGPVENVETDDLARRVMQSVGRLPDVQREVFLMRVQGDLSFSEIAQTLGVPLNTALGRMHDAMNKLKKMLADEGGGQ